MSVVDQKRIAKNTALLYVRMILVLAVSLYTSSVIIYALGKDDFGIYVSVGAIVSLFSFLSTTLASACQRFFAVELANNNYEEVQRVFSMYLIAFVVIGVLMIIMVEPVGWWLVNFRLPMEGREYAANWVLHFCILGSFFSILRVPYQGLVIARERMNIFAYISVFEALANLGVALILKNSERDRLILYVMFLMLIQGFITLFYYLYCRICYKESRFSLYYDKEKLMKIFKFSAWEMLGSFAGTLKSKGVNTMLHDSFGADIAGARGVADRVYSSISQLKDNFFMAVKPQITKSYAANEMDEMRKLVAQSTRFIFYLLFIVSLPIILEAETLLNLWLVDVPPFAIFFTQLLLINALLDTFSSPFTACVQSTGKNKYFNICVSIVSLSILPFAYICFNYFGLSPDSVFYISMVLSVIAQFVRFGFVRKQIGFNTSLFLKQVIMRIVGVVLLSMIIPIALKFMIQESIFNSFLIIVVSMISTAVVSYIIGITKTERKHINEMTVSFFRLVTHRR